MSSAAQAYARTAQATSSPRELEAHLLMKAASKLQAVAANWPASQGELDPALLYNRRLWTIFVAAMQEPDRPVPDAVRQNIMNLGIFVFKQIYETQLKPGPERLRSMIEINRNLAAGLRGQA